jgi:hypothetical protein
MPMKMPNFLVIGAAKAGTTALYHMLEQHPQIYMSPTKETNFFALEGDLKANFQIGGLHGLGRNSVTTLEDYQALFNDVPDHVKAIGEASPAYLYVPEAPERIKHHLPHAKLIAILRNPVERAYSAFLFKSWQGHEPLLNFAEALQQEDVRITDKWHWIVHYKNMGFYYRQLSRYFAIFDRSQIMVCFYEDLQNHPQELLQSIYEFIGVDRDWVPDPSTRYLPTGGLPKNQLLHNLITKSLAIANSIKVVLKIIPKSWRLWIFYTINDIRRNNSNKQPLPIEIRKQLIAEYHDDILKLQDLVQRDLSAWLEVDTN